MITESTIYWITRLDGLNILFATIMLVGIGYMVATWMTNETLKLKHWYCASIIIALGLVGLIFVPTTKEMAMIKIIPAIANSKLVAEDLPRDAQQLYELSKKALIEMLTDTETKK